MKYLAILILIIGCGKKVSNHKTSCPQRNTGQTRTHEYEFHLNAPPGQSDCHILSETLKFEIPLKLAAVSDDDHLLPAKAKLIIHGLGECFYSAATAVSSYQDLDYCTGIENLNLVQAGTLIEVKSLDNVYLAGWCWYKENETMRVMD